MEDFTVSRLCFACRLPFGRSYGRFCVSFNVQSPSLAKLHYISKRYNLIDLRGGQGFVIGITF